ncbi:MAG: hypothetical protein IOD12_13655 [Silvanigrellales bacterium]|jgi:hypothetical protein|nr:hypothetical protein [Silvanigrellales bacterium]
MARLKRFFVVTLGCAAWGATALAYPVLVDAKSVPNLLGADRAHLTAIAPKKEGGFQKLAVQVDEVEDGAAIVFRKPSTPLALRKEHAHPSDRDPFGGKLDEVHRVVLDDELFGTCDAACSNTAKAEARKACGVSETATVGITRLDLDFLKTTAFLVDCRKKQKAAEKTPIKVDMKERTFTTNTYSYTYKDKKNILFENISLLPERKRLLTDGELLVYLKPKYVFNMQFAEKDLVSRITSISQGPLSTGVEVAFSLDVLSFKVNSQICCDVSLYKDSLYFPVMLDLPFEGSSFKKGSGLFYGLNIEGDVKKDVKFMAEKLSDYQFVEAKPRADGGSSALLVQNGDKIVAVGFRSMKAATKDSKNAPLVAFKEDLKKIEFPEVRSNFGLFYDVTSLAKGFHHFNVWFYVGGKEQEAMLGEYAKNGITYKSTPVH